MVSLLAWSSCPSTSSWKMPHHRPHTTVSPKDTLHLPSRRQPLDVFASIFLRPADGDSLALSHPSNCPCWSDTASVNIRAPFRPLVQLRGIADCRSDAFSLHRRSVLDMSRALHLRAWPHRHSGRVFACRTRVPSLLLALRQRATPAVASSSPL